METFHLRFIDVMILVLDTTHHSLPLIFRSNFKAKFFYSKQANYFSSLLIEKNWLYCTQAENLFHPRWMRTLKNESVFVREGRNEEQKNINRGAMENETFWCESIHISLYIMEMWMNLFLSTNLSQFFFSCSLSHSSSSFLSSYFYFCFSVSFSVSFVVWNSCCSLLTNNEAKMSNTSSRTSTDKHSLT